jgi:putative ABC transport system ATP-binding protein
MTAIDARAAAATRLEGSGNTDDSVVKLAGVTKTYQRGATAVNALDRIDLEVRRGDFAVLVGPSGSGKTTLLNMIGGLDTPTSGRVWVAGTEIGRMSKADRSQMRLRSIGFVFQEFNLIPVLSAIENTEFVMLLQGVPAAERRARACALLKELGLEGMEQRRPSELSGGQQQRVAVARALAGEPLILLPSHCERPRPSNALALTSESEGSRGDRDAGGGRRRVASISRERVRWRRGRTGTVHDPAPRSCPRRDASCS